MTLQQQTALEQIAALKAATIDTILALHRQAAALRDAGQTKEAAAIRRKASGLTRDAMILSDLQDQINASLPLQPVIDALRNATNDAQTAVSTLQQVAGALKTAEKLVGLLRNLAKIAG